MVIFSGKCYKLFQSSVDVVFKLWKSFFDFLWNLPCLCISIVKRFMIYLELNGIYHIYNHANGDENLFRNNQNYLYFLKRYAHFIHPIAKTYAYCLMPNHFHVLVKIRSKEEIVATLPKFETLEKLTELEELTFDKFISKQFSNLFSSYTQSFNKVFKRKGSLFIKNFKRKPIKSNSYFISTLQYIHRNPVHHGFCTNIEDWNWSSYHSLISQKSTLLEKKEIMDWFGTKEYFAEAHKLPDKNYVELSHDDFY